jgi:hypothetical protein
MDVGNYALSILVSPTIGLIGFVIAFKIFDWLTPGIHFADQLKADNRQSFYQAQTSLGTSLSRFALYWQSHILGFRRFPQNADQ